ncbi:MAG: AtpZ/AtpI family protein [Planctomycetota bacterium]
MPAHKPHKPNRRRPQNELWALAGMGTELTGSIVGMTLIGWLIDTWLGTLPVFLLIGVAFGLFGGGYNFMRKAMAIASAPSKRTGRRLAPRPARPVTPGPAGAELFDRTSPTPEQLKDERDVSFPPGFEDDAPDAERHS